METGGGHQVGGHQLPLFQQQGGPDGAFSSPSPDFHVEQQQVGEGRSNGVKMMVKVEMVIILHHMVLNFQWEPFEQDHPIAFPFVKFPKGLPNRVHKLPATTVDWNP
uniref:Uncharacterized protein n=1 Tax=Nymphaea colorata TaxID=210225 RepID=A0A5K1H7U0_9MAGN|nr:unnamed protein product [Nymphaea colorata]